MTSVTRARARSALVSGVAVLLFAGSAGCDSGDDLGTPAPGTSASPAAAPPPVTTVTTLQGLGKRLGPDERAQVKSAVTALVDPWLDGAYLGDFPRSDWSTAFRGFTSEAAGTAQHRDRALLTNAGIADRIDSATATRRRVRVNLFAYHGHPEGATAHVVLEFDTTGELQESLRVRGDLYLAKDQGKWKVFGYDIDQAEQL
jgi:hypothetical protein